MKKIILLILFTVVGYANSTDTYHVVNVAFNDTLNVRSAGGTNYSIVGELPYNARNIKVDSCATNRGARWCYIHYASDSANISGWVHTKYIELDDEEETTTAKMLVYQSTTARALKRLPNLDAKTVVHLENRTLLTVRSCSVEQFNEEWCYVKIYDVMIDGDFEGWIQKKYLKPYTNRSYVNIVEGLPVDLFPTVDSRTPHKKLTQAQNCYFALSCDKDRCNIVYDIDMGDGTIRQKGIKMGWIRRDNLVAATKFTAMPEAEQEGYCMIGDMLEVFLDQQKDK